MAAADADAAEPDAADLRERMLDGAVLALREERKAGGRRELAPDGDDLVLVQAAEHHQGLAAVVDEGDLEIVAVRVALVEAEREAGRARAEAADQRVRKSDDAAGEIDPAGESRACGGFGVARGIRPGGGMERGHV